MTRSLLPSPLLDSAGSLKGHFRELDGLRGIAILLVMLHHFWPKGGSLESLASLAHLGWTGVDLFFVISGFLIAGILLDTTDDPDYYRNFYVRRALRIFPLYYLFLVAVFVVVPLAERESYFDTRFIQESGSPIWYFLYLGNIRECLAGGDSAYFLAPLWSLSIEEQFYIAFPPIVVLLGPARLRRFLVLLIAAAPLFRLAMFWLFPDDVRLSYLATPCRMDALALGCLLAVLFRTKPVLLEGLRSSIIPMVLLAGCATAFMAGGLDRTNWFCRTAGYSLVGLTVASILAWTVWHRHEAGTALLRWGPLCGLGKICYGVYLLQRPCEIGLLKVCDRLGIDVDEGSLGLMLMKCATAILVALGSWHIFEKRILRFKERFASTAHPSLDRQPVMQPAIAQLTPV